MNLGTARGLLFGPPDATDAESARGALDGSRAWLLSARAGVLVNAALGIVLGAVVALIGWVLLGEEAREAPCSSKTVSFACRTRSERAAVSAATGALYTFLVITSVIGLVSALRRQRKIAHIYLILLFVNLVAALGVGIFTIVLYVRAFSPRPFKPTAYLVGAVIAYVAVWIWDAAACYTAHKYHKHLSHSRLSSSSLAPSLTAPASPTSTMEISAHSLFLTRIHLALSKDAPPGTKGQVPPKIVLSRASTLQAEVEVEVERQEEGEMAKHRSLVPSLVGPELVIPATPRRSIATLPPLAPAPTSPLPVPTPTRPYFPSPTRPYFLDRTPSPTRTPSSTRSSFLASIPPSPSPTRPYFLARTPTPSPTRSHLRTPSPTRSSISAPSSVTAPMPEMPPMPEMVERRPDAARASALERRPMGSKIPTPASTRPLSVRESMQTPAASMRPSMFDNRSERTPARSNIPVPSSSTRPPDAPSALRPSNSLRTTRPAGSVRTIRPLNVSRPTRPPRLELDAGGIDIGPLMADVYVGTHTLSVVVEESGSMKEGQGEGEEEESAEGRMMRMVRQARIRQTRLRAVGLPAAVRIVDKGKGKARDFGERDGEREWL